MLDRNVVADVLTAALGHGGDFAELYVENTVRNGIRMVNGVVEKAVSGVDYGCGIRIFSGLNGVYAYTNDTSRENLLRVASELSCAVKSGQSAKVMNFASREPEVVHQVRILPGQTPKTEICGLLRKGGEASKLYSDKVTQTSGDYLDIVQDVLVANSEGLWATDRRVRSRVVLEAVASSDTEKQAGRHAPGFHRGYEFTEEIDIEDIGRRVARQAVTMLSADMCPSGKMPVIIDNEFGGVLFHEACGHSLEATGIAIGASEFCGKQGTEIASPIVTAIDDGTLPNHWGSQSMDDEGTPTQRNVLIENGILKSYLIDKLNGRRMNQASTGSSRRESYRFAPTSRMTNTYIDNGKSTPEEIIANTEYGLFAKTMGGGSVWPTTGEFNFAVSEGYIVRNGKIAEPVRGATLIGKGGQVLKNIDMVGNNLDFGSGMCGSLSGSVPTNCGQPRIRIKELTVGGRN